MVIKIRKKYENAGYLIPLYSPNKKGIEMGFNWLFAIMAGGFILFLAIYATGRMISLGSVTTNTLTAKNFVNILETWEAGLAAGVKPPELLFKTDTKLFFSCDASMNAPFGLEAISTSEKKFNKQYSQEGYSVNIYNKYIFTENQLEGKTFYPFSFGYFMPFKIADLIIFSDRNYCFYDAPSEFKNDLELLSMKNIVFPNKTSVCEGVKVCFANGKNCDIMVSINGKYVLKENEKLFYDGNLIYAAIFSSPEIYKCNIKRLVAKFNQLGAIYLDKIKIIEREQCKSNVENKLYQMMIISENFTYSQTNVLGLLTKSAEIDVINNDADPGCKLYKNEER